jgi:hypothetical protein
MDIAKAKAINGDSDLEVVTFKPDDEEQIPKSNRQKRKERRLAVISEKSAEEEESKDGQTAEEIRPQIWPTNPSSGYLKALQKSIGSKLKKEEKAPEDI